jgi:hypothetical protein
MVEILLLLSFRYMQFLIVNVYFLCLQYIVLYVHMFVCLGGGCTVCVCIYAYVVDHVLGSSLCKV